MVEFNIKLVKLFSQYCLIQGYYLMVTCQAETKHIFNKAWERAN